MVIYCIDLHSQNNDIFNIICVLPDSIIFQQELNHLYLQASVDTTPVAIPTLQPRMRFSSLEVTGHSTSRTLSRPFNLNLKPCLFMTSTHFTHLKILPVTVPSFSFHTLSCHTNLLNFILSPFLCLCLLQHLWFEIKDLGQTGLQLHSHIVQKIQV